MMLTEVEICWSICDVRRRKHESWVPINQFNQPTYLCLSQHYIIWWFCVQWFEVQDDRSICWCWYELLTITFLLFITYIETRNSFYYKFYMVQYTQWIKWLYIAQNLHYTSVKSIKLSVMFLWLYVCVGGSLDWFDFWCFNTTFRNISAISWRPVLVVGEAGVPAENHQPWASNW